MAGLGLLRSPLISTGTLLRGKGKTGKVIWNNNKIKPNDKKQPTQVKVYCYLCQLQMLRTQHSPKDKSLEDKEKGERLGIIGF